MRDWGSLLEVVVVEVVEGGGSLSKLVDPIFENLENVRHLKSVIMNHLFFLLV